MKQLNGQLIFSFTDHDAINYGLHEAIVLDKIRQFIHLNRSKEINYYNEKYWCFGSAKFWERYFTFLSHRQIERALKSLVDNGALIRKYGLDHGPKMPFYTLNDQVQFTESVESNSPNESRIKPILGNWSLYNSKSTLKNIHTEKAAPSNKNDTFQQVQHNKKNDGQLLIEKWQELGLREIEYRSASHQMNLPGQLIRVMRDNHIDLKHAIRALERFKHINMSEHIHYSAEWSIWAFFGLTGNRKIYDQFLDENFSEKNYKASFKSNTCSIMPESVKEERELYSSLLNEFEYDEYYRSLSGDESICIIQFFTDKNKLELLKKYGPDFITKGIK